MTKPVTPRRLETRERLLNAAFGTFAELGVAGSSVEAICQAAGFSRGAFYSNFSSKEELFLGLLGREYQHRTARLRSATEAFLQHRVIEQLPLGVEEVTGFIREFFRLENLDSAWFVLEAEFLLLAIRDAKLGAEYRNFSAASVAGLALVIDEIVAVAGWRFTLERDLAIMLLTAVYERTLREQALTGSAPGAVPQHLIEQLTTVLFAIVEANPGVS